MLTKKSDQQILKVGVLLPQSREYPKAAMNFLNGMKLYFTLHENHFERGRAEFIVEDVGLGTESISIEKAHKLMTHDQVIAVTGLLEPMIGLEVGKMTGLAGKPTMFSGLGESAIVPSKVPDNLYFNTLQLWQSHFLLGQYAAENFKKPFNIITSFYDCGYDPLMAFRLGLKSREGVINSELILKAQNEEELRAEVEEKVRFNDDCMPVALLHPKLLHQFVALCGDHIQEMISTPFYDQNDEMTKHWSCSVWRNDSKLSQIFCAGVEEFFDVEADIFNALGYQQGHLIYEALKQLSAPELDDQSIIETWKDFDQETIVGRSYFDKEGNALKSPITICSGSNTRDQFTAQKTCYSDFEKQEGLEDLFSMRNSYTNPYLFF